MISARLAYLTLSTALLHFWRMRAHHAGASAVIAVMLVLLTATAVAGQLALSISAAIADRVAVVVYIELGSSSTDVTRIERGLLADERVREVVYVSPAEALARLRAQGGSEAGAFDKIGAEALPGTFEIRPRSPADSRGLAEEVRSWTGVADVVSEDGLVRRVARMLDLVLVLVAIASLAAVMSAVFVIGSVLRVAVYARRREIRAMTLLGASDRLTAGPFVIEGALAAVAGAAGAAAFLRLCAGPAAEALRPLAAAGAALDAAQLTAAFSGAVVMAIAVAALSARAAVHAHIVHPVP